MLDLLTVQETLKISTELKLSLDTKPEEKNKIASIFTVIIEERLNFICLTD